MKLKMIVSCLSITTLLWISLAISGGNELSRTTNIVTSGKSIPGNVGGGISGLSGRNILYQCRVADEYLMCPTCTGETLEECESKQRMEPCRSETERCATTKLFNVRGVLEITKKGCQTSEACGETTADPSHAGHCDSRLGKYVRCVKCDDVMAGTCLPGGATASPAEGTYIESQWTALLSWRRRSFVLWTISSVVVVCVVVVVVAMTTRRCMMTQSRSVHISWLPRKRWPRFSDTRYVSFA